MDGRSYRRADHGAVADASLSWGEAQLRQAAAVFALLWLRLAPMTVVLPVLGLPSRPVVASGALSLTVALCLWPVALLSSSALPDGALPLLPLALRELLIGGVLALALAGPLLSLRWAGALADRLLDPDSGQAPAAGAIGDAQADTPLSSLYLWCGLLLLLSMGGHRLVIETMGGHLIDTPIGATAAVSALRPALLGSARVVGDALLLSVSLAAPVLIAAVVIELGGGLLARLTDRGAGPAPLSIRRLLLIGVVMVGAPMLVGRLPALFRDALERAATIL